jgi:branched-subunit amino acid aminotransferase/4-amino-4-deoxychorismate lyase
MTRRAPVLLETVRVRQGAAPLWYLHLRRLSASCIALGAPFPPRLEVPIGGPDRVHRLEVSQAGVKVTTREVGSATPLQLVLSAVVHAPYPHKTADRSVFERAAAGARAAGADDAILLTPTGLVAECAIWCLFWWEAGRVAAPPLSLRILPGVSRLRIEELAGPVLERRVSAGEAAGRSLFAANAVRGVVPVATLDGRPVAPDPGTAHLAERFWT